MAVSYTSNLGLGLQDDNEASWGAVERQSWQRIEDRLAAVAAGTPTTASQIGYFVGMKFFDSSAAEWYDCTAAATTATGSSWSKTKGMGMATSVPENFVQTAITTNLSVGVTSDEETVSFSSEVVPNLQAEGQKIMTATGDWTLQVPTATVAGEFLLRVLNNGAVTFTAGTNVTLVSGEYDTTASAINLIAGAWFPTASDLRIAVK